jgi:hypothetical protein
VIGAFSVAIVRRLRSPSRASKIPALVTGVGVDHAVIEPCSIRARLQQASMPPRMSSVAVGPLDARTPQARPGAREEWEQPEGEAPEARRAGARRRGTPVATARRGAASASRSSLDPASFRPADPTTRPLMRPGAAHAVRGAALPQASFSGPATPSSSPRRPPGWGWGRSRSPTTTASTGWCASPRRPAPSACPRCSARRSASPRPAGWCAPNTRHSTR